jgi:F0F1-type ATP synthase membrane subunit b/b'
MQHTTLLGLAAAAEHPLIDIDFTAFVQFGIFAAAFLVATTLVFRPYLRMRDARDAATFGAREEAARLAAEAEARLVDYERRVEAARARAFEERRKIRAEAATSYRELTEKTKAEATSTVIQARNKLVTDVEAARKELLPRADRLAAAIASKLLGREVA